MAKPKYELGDRLYTIHNNDLHVGTVSVITHSKNGVQYKLTGTNFIDIALEKWECEVAADPDDLWLRLKKQYGISYKKVLEIDQ